jgi:hypothetical protein
MLTGGSVDRWNVDIAAQLEQNACIIAAAIPTFPHLFKTWMRTIRERRYGRSPKKSSLLTKHSLPKGMKSSTDKRHPYNDITAISNITVKHDVEPLSSSQNKAGNDGW